MPTQRSKVNVESDLLSCEENRRLRQLLGHRRLALAAAVAQLVVTSSPSHTSWQLIHTGVVCFTRDSGRRSHYIQLYGPDSLLWEQELYQNFQFNRVRPFFSTFEADSCQAGLSFADEREADVFSTSVETHVREKQRRRQVRQRGRAASHASASSGGAGGGDNHTRRARHSNGAVVPAVKSATAGGGSRTASKKLSKLSKADISSPTNFQHLSHVGWDPNRGFDLENVDPNLKAFFSRAGVSERHLQDQDTRKFIYDFIRDHGGVEAAIEEASSVFRPGAASAPAHHQRAPPPPPAPPNRQRQTVASQADRTASGQRAATTTAGGQRSHAAASGGAPPPPPPPPPPPTSSEPALASLSHKPPPPAPSAAAVTSNRTLVTTGVCQPPPPPPPPPPNMPPPPPPPPSSAEFSSCPPPSGTADPSVSDGRSALLQSIRQGMSLKHVQHSTGSTGASRSSSSCSAASRAAAGGGGGDTNATGMAGALARALADRKLVMHSSDESDTTINEDEDDEWDC